MGRRLFIGRIKCAVRIENDSESQRSKASNKVMQMLILVFFIDQGQS